MTFRSKIDWWLAAIMLLVIAVSLVTAVAASHGRSNGGLLTAAAVFVIGTVLPAWLLLSTAYTIESEVLIVRSGPIRQRIPLDQISDIRPSSNPISSPALSLDRLEIHYGQKRILISPKDKQGFIKAIRDAQRALEQR
ncbi:PH domain-containing protein [Xanthomonas translucens]|uniref:PH domain-containing protein n=1 Tax=Xanthomonas campestris pv. translucens TaxID=343 RepID=UPI0009BFF1F5